MLDLSLDNWWICYEKVWAVVYLIPSDTKVLEIYLSKNIKFYMMRSCMTKLEFLPEPYMLFRLGKLPHICWLLLHWVLSSFVDPYERFVMLLKSRSHTHHPNMHYSYTGGRRNNMPFHLDSPKNILLLHWEKTLKICFIGFHHINAPSSSYYLSNNFYVKKKHGLCKSYS